MKIRDIWFRPELKSTAHEEHERFCQYLEKTVERKCGISIDAQVRLGLVTKISAKEGVDYNQVQAIRKVANQLWESGRFLNY